MPYRFMGFAAFAALSLSCASVEDRVTLQSERELEPVDYRGALARWTRSDEIYSGLHSVLFVHATLHSPDFRRAFLLRHPDVYGPGSEEAGRLLLTGPEAELHHELFMSVSTSKPTWNDFQQESSIWRITLHGDDGEPVDGEVRLIKTTANLRVIYPYITDFARTYALRFPLKTVSGRPVLSPATRRLVLRIASALGEAELVWALEGS